MFFNEDSASNIHLVIISDIRNRNTYWQYVRGVAEQLRVVLNSLFNMNVGDGEALDGITAGLILLPDNEGGVIARVAGRGENLA